MSMCVPAFMVSAQQRECGAGGLVVRQLLDGANMRSQQLGDS